MLEIKSQLREGVGWAIHGMKVRTGLIAKSEHAPADVVEMGEEFAWNLLRLTGVNFIVLKDDEEKKEIHLRIEHDGAGRGTLKIIGYYQ